MKRAGCSGLARNLGGATMFAPAFANMFVAALCSKLLLLAVLEDEEIENRHLFVHDS